MATALRRGEATGPATADELAADEAQVQAAAAGDTQAFLAIYDRHARDLYRYAVRRLGDPSKAEDLVQEVFLAIVRRGASFRARVPVRVFLFRIARNRVYNLWRDQRPEVELDPGRGHTPRYDDVFDVRRAMATLPDVFREPLSLAMYDGFSYEEIGELLGCPIGTVRSRIARAKGRLATMLSEGRTE